MSETPEVPTINFAKGFEDKEEAKKVVKQIQDVLDSLVLANQDSIKLLKEREVDIDKAIDTITDQNTQITEFVGMLKNIHLLMATYHDVFKECEPLDEVFTYLSKFIISSGAVKVGALAYDKEKQDEQDAKSS